MEIFIIREGQQTGPFNEEAVQKLLKSGGLHGTDMGWRKGLPGWLPINEVLHPGSEQPSAPPPAPGMSGIRAVSGISQKRATNKQKALLKYIGATFEADLTKLEAAEAISEALENPRLTSRFTKWSEEKLRLHPDYYQDEIDYRRANRVARFVELCETDGADAVKGVTKAHVQVLVESLDKKDQKWDTDPKSALWDHLLPAIAEHFPPLVQEGWKERLAPARKGATRTPTRTAIAGNESPPSAIGAALRGIAYGVLLLGVFLGAMHFLNSKNEPVAPTKEAAANTTSKIAATTPTVGADLPPQQPLPLDASILPPPAPPVAPATQETSLPTFATIPPINPATPPAATPPATPEMTTPPAPIPQPAPADPTPIAPATTMAPPATTPPAAKDIVTITKPVPVQLQFGKVTLNPGTKMRLIAVEGANVRANFNNNIISVPLSSTDADPNAPAPTPATRSVPAAPKPSSDL